MSNNLETIVKHYTVARKRTGPIKKFTAMGREHLKLDWFGAVGIAKKYRSNIYKFIDAFLQDESSPFFIETIFKNEGRFDYEACTGNFADALDATFKSITRTPVKVVTASGKKKPHAAFKKVSQLATLERQVFIAGPAGTGKSTLGEQIAESMNLEFGHISCTSGMSEAHLLGRMDAHGEYLESLFVRLFENGGVFLFDEVDAADANTMLIINSALANNRLSIPNRKDNPTADRHPDFICICAANTWGFGSNEYAGRNILDAAFLDRFVGSKVMVDYDVKVEREIGAGNEKLLEVMWNIRKNVKENRIRRIVSTRAIISGVRQLNAGISLEDFLDTFFTGWTAEEVKKAKENLNLNVQNLPNDNNAI